MACRSIENIPMKERYICRGDKKGIIYDRKAMLKASEMLGHNREEVVSNNYLHDLSESLREYMDISKSPEPVENDNSDDDTYF